MGFWQGLTKRLGIGIISYVLIAVVVLTVSMFVGDPDKIMVYSFIIVPIISISAASIYYIKY